MGGTLSFRAPWPVTAVDPHRLDDAGAMFFGRALFDTLFTLDPNGAVVPSLAETLPEPCPEGVRISLREGLRFHHAGPVSPRDVLQSIERVRAKDGRGWLEPLGTLRIGPAGTLIASTRSPERAARLLASPLTAVVPQRFVPEEPDGTGPFAVPRPRAAGILVLSRNATAASGPAFLDRVTVASAPDLAASLRAFESGEDDLGWLGLGLHEPRRGSVSFDAGVVGVAILRTGSLGQRWDAPGVAQRLADGVDPSALAHLGVLPEWSVDPSDGWGGSPSSLLVRDDSPWLLELARAVAAALSRPDHELTVRPLPPKDFADARTSRSFALAVDVVRPFDGTPFGASCALTSADDLSRGVELARHPPLGTPPPLRSATRLLRVGVLASIHVSGGHLPDLTLPVLSPNAGTGLDFASNNRPAPRVR